MTTLSNHPTSKSPLLQPLPQLPPQVEEKILEPSDKLPSDQMTMKNSLTSNGPQTSWSTAMRVGVPKDGEQGKVAMSTS